METEWIEICIEAHGESGEVLSTNAANYAREELASLRKIAEMRTPLRFRIDKQRYSNVGGLQVMTVATLLNENKSIATVPVVDMNHYNNTHEMFIQISTHRMDEDSIRDLCDAFAASLGFPCEFVDNAECEKS